MVSWGGFNFSIRHSNLYSEWWITIVWAYAWCKLKWSSKSIGYNYNWKKTFLLKFLFLNANWTFYVHSFELFILLLKHRDVYIVSQWNLKLIFSPLRRQGVGFHLDGFKLESNSNLKPRYSNFLKETDTSFIIDVK